MLRWKLSQYSAVLFGVFALYAAGQAIPVALAYPREFAHDAIRFGTIAVAAAFGLTLLQPHRPLPALRRFGGQYSPFAPRFVCAVGLFAALFAARLSGAIPGWVSWPVGILCFAVFVLPGFAFFGLSKQTLEAIRAAESGRLIGEYMKERPRSERYAFRLILILLLIGTCCIVFSKKALPEPNWSQFVTVFSILIGVLIAGWWTVLSIRTTPTAARRGTLPGTILMALVLLLLGVFSFRALLLDALPNTATKLWGSEAVQIVTVERSDPIERRKGCRGLLTIKAEAGRRDICNLKTEFLSAIAPGDTLAIYGKATIFGQTIDRLQLRPEV